MIKWIKPFFESPQPEYVNLTRLTNQELIYYLDNYVLSVGTGNRIVLELLKRLVKEADNLPMDKQDVIDLNRETDALIGDK